MLPVNLLLLLLELRQRLVLGVGIVREELLSGFGLLRLRQLGILESLVSLLPQFVVDIRLALNFGKLCLDLILLSVRIRVFGPVGHGQVLVTTERVTGLLGLLDRVIVFLAQALDLVKSLLVDLSAGLEANGGTVGRDAVTLLLLDEDLLGGLLRSRDGCWFTIFTVAVSLLLLFTEN